MKKNPGLVALLGALAQQTRQRGGSPSVQEIEASAALVGQLLEQWSAVRGEVARRHSLNGNDPELAVEIGKMDALIEQVTGTAA
jgi:hypothetical protein